MADLLTGSVDCPRGSSLNSCGRIFVKFSLLLEGLDDSSFAIVHATHFVILKVSYISLAVLSFNRFPIEMAHLIFEGANPKKANHANIKSSEYKHSTDLLSTRPHTHFDLFSFFYYLFYCRLM